MIKNWGKQAPGRGELGQIWAMKTRFVKPKKKEKGERDLYYQKRNKNEKKHQEESQVN
jgi:hypothetical protein